MSSSVRPAAMARTGAENSRPIVAATSARSRAAGERRSRRAVITAWTVGVSATGRRCTGAEPRPDRLDDEQWVALGLRPQPRRRPEAGAPVRRPGRPSRRSRPGPEDRERSRVGARWRRHRSSTCAPAASSSRTVAAMRTGAAGALRTRISHSSTVSVSHHWRSSTTSSSGRPAASRPRRTASRRWCRRPGSVAGGATGRSGCASRSSGRSRASSVRQAGPRVSRHVATGPDRSQSITEPHGGRLAAS